MADLYVVIIGDGPIHYEPGEDQHDGVDDLEVRGPFTQDEATDYAMRLGRYMVLVAPLNPADTPDGMLTRPSPPDWYSQWMVRSNLARIANGEMSADTNVALLRANGYDHVADAVEAASRD